MNKNKIANILLLLMFCETASLALEVKKKSKIEKHTFKANAELGVGYDSNPYLAPSVSYYDLTRTAVGTLIVPNIQSGFFVPAKVKLSYEYRLDKDIRLLSSFKFSGKYFTNADLQNANQYKTVLKMGTRFRFNKYKKETNKIEIVALVGNVDRIYVDHDDGTIKTTGANNDQSNRYKYKKVGADIKYVYEFKKIDFLANLRYEDRDYEDPATWSSLDHKYTKLRIQSGYQLTKSFHIGAYYEYALRDYRERKSYEIDPDGTIRLRKPGVKYTYHGVKVYGDYKITKDYKMSLDYALTSRVDDNQGYSDYLYHRIYFSNNYKITKDLRVYLDLDYYLYDYENAYAFDTNTGLERKEANGYDIDFRTKYRISSDTAVKLDLSYKNAFSNDYRYHYNEMIGMLSLKYTF